MLTTVFSATEWDDPTAGEWAVFARTAVTPALLVVPAR
jgi:hypothetical protein